MRPRTRAATRARSMALAGARARAQGQGAGEPSPPRAGVDHQERSGLAELAPPAVDGPRHQRAVQLPDLGAGDEVTSRPSRAARLLEERAGPVQREVDERVERD